MIVEIIAHAPTAFYHCAHCELVWQQGGVGQTLHSEQMESNLPDDVMQEYRRLSDWIIALVNRHGGRRGVSVGGAARLLPQHFPIFYMAE